MKSMPLCMVALIVSTILYSGCNAGGGKVRVSDKEYSLNECFAEGTPAWTLANAAGSGNVQKLKKAIDAGTDVNTVGKSEFTPLWWAAAKGNFSGFEYLLKRGANPNAQRKDGCPIMILAAWQKDVRFLQCALQHGGNPNTIDMAGGGRPLFWATTVGWEAHIDALISAKADLNAQMPASGITLPMTAIASRKDYKLAYRFLELGADPKLTTTNNKTLEDFIALATRNALNKNDPWRDKVLELLHKTNTQPQSDNLEKKRIE